jgi:hypothetical protein
MMKSETINDESPRGLSGGGTTGAVSGTSPVRLYREVQRLNQWIFWVPIAIATAVVWWAFFKQVVFSRPVGQEPIPDWLAWVLAFVFGFGLPALGWAIRLITEVRPGLVWVRLSPFRGIRIAVKEIERAFTREYSDIREYGGWGVRVNRFGRAYNAYGNQGVQLELVKGRRILIGSQRPDELLTAIRSAGADIE